MRVAFIAALSALMLFPASSGLAAEFSDTPPSLTVSLSSDSPFVYRDSEGYTVVIGQVVNSNDLVSVANVQVSADFFDDVSPLPLESGTGTTVLEVIPPLGSSPYMIKSKSANSAITKASVQLDGFGSSPSKLKQLTVEGDNLLHVDGALSFSGVLKNGAAPISDTNVYAAFYDGFDPPRIVGIHTVPLGNILPNETVPFEFDEKISPRAVGFHLFSESNVFYSDFVNMKIPAPQALTKLATIKNVAVKDAGGSTLSGTIPVGSTVSIESESRIQFSDNLPSDTTPYTYFVQIKPFGKMPYVEFLGQYDGLYVGAGTQTPSVKWTPQNTGEFFVETFVWDRNHVPIAERGPFMLISVK